MKTEDKIFRYIINQLNKEGLLNLKHIDMKDFYKIWDKVSLEVKKRYLK